MDAKLGMLSLEFGPGIWNLARGATYGGAADRSAHSAVPIWMLGGMDGKWLGGLRFSQKARTVRSKR